MMRLLLTASLVVFLGYWITGKAHAEPWPKVAFAEWPSIPVSKIKATEPAVFPMDVPGAVQPKPKPPVPARRTCQEKQPLGYFLPVSC